ncbi:MAG: hypothetical protein MR828_03810 [Clostridiales bacterium]|nr:hypothetical protein [Clostridiales bacterium]
MRGGTAQATSSLFRVQRMKKLRKYFLRSDSPVQMEAVIFKLLESWQRRHQHDKSR